MRKNISTKPRPSQEEIEWYKAEHQECLQRIKDEVLKAVLDEVTTLIKCEVKHEINRILSSSDGSTKQLSTSTEVQIDTPSSIGITQKEMPMVVAIISALMNLNPPHHEINKSDPIRQMRELTLDYFGYQPIQKEFLDSLALELQGISRPTVRKYHEKMFKNLSLP